MPAAEAEPVSDAEARELFAELASFPALILAVSGGPDSTALLVLAARWRRRLKKAPKLVAVTVDHGLRPESAGEARAVKRLAARLGVDHATRRWRGRKPASRLQEAAREARYRLLIEAARKAKACAIVTAHTLDDQAETVLFRLARGSGLAGLGGMARRSALGDLALVRPLLEVPKARLVATLEAAGVTYADDASNRDPRFARPRWRALGPLLAAEGLDAKRLATFARRMRRAEDALSDFVAQALAHTALLPWPTEGAGLVAIDATKFFALPAEVSLRLLGAAIDRVGSEGPAALGKLEALHEALQERRTGGSGVRFRRTLAGAVVALSAGRIEVCRAPPRRIHAQSDR